MKKERIIVPPGFKYIGDWKEYSLENYQYPHILNKSITGCGYTEYCIRSSLNVVLCSPRRVLLANKEDQHMGEVFYVRNEVDAVPDFEKSLNIKNPLIKDEKPRFNRDETKSRLEDLRDRVLKYYESCKASNKPCKLLVTYDSFRRVKEALGPSIKDFYVVIDEMQSIFTDAKFKSETEIGFVEHLKGLDRVCFVSATPMMTKYLEILEYFKDLPYIELDWEKEDPSRVSKPKLEVTYCDKSYDNSIQYHIKSIIASYRMGYTKQKEIRDRYGNIKETVVSKEAVFYVNSVWDICNAIKASRLQPEEVNILCADSLDNELKIKNAFGAKPWDDIKYIGRVPKKGEHHKMFTFCTRTVYLGADFYSTNARTFIFSNANIDCLSVDVSLDLPQILGRQRLKENPWKNEAELYITLRCCVDEDDREDFIEEINMKIERKNKLLEIYNDSGSDEKKKLIAEMYDKMVKAYNYRDDYVAVNNHIPTFNNLMMVADIRTFEIQEIDYANRFSVRSNLRSSGNIPSTTSKTFVKSFLLQGVSEDSVRQAVLEHFKVGERYPKDSIKTELANIYEELGYESEASANDLKKWFEVKTRYITKKGEKRIDEFEILAIKEEEKDSGD